MKSPDTTEAQKPQQRCHLCPHHCPLREGAIGRCRARMCRDGRSVPLSYGAVSSIALDPIEKKPLYHFHPGSMILSVGGWGCNLRCPFCQNHEISMSGATGAGYEILPEALADLAVREAQNPRGNLGVAYTYNEPLVAYEYVRDCAKLVRAQGLCNVLVTNGQICQEPLTELLPLIDALNIDLKGFSEDFYRYVGGDFQTALESIKLSAAMAHVEVTTLIVPGRNDDPRMMREEAKFLASISADLPLHISRFFPRYKELELPPTPIPVIRNLCAVAAEHLSHVYAGNC